MKRFIKAAALFVCAAMLLSALAVFPFADDGEIPPCEEHTWGDWVVDTPATYWDEGKATRKCEVCSASEDMILDKLSNPFKDVNLSRWYAHPVMFCYDSGYMVGVSETRFSLSDPVSRAMIVQIMARLANADLKLPEYNVSNFSDVAVGKWYTRAVEWARVNNMANGTGGGKFSPNASITRQELAVFLFKLAEFVKGETPEFDTASVAEYRDINELASWANKAMSWAIGCGIMHGTTPYHLSPRITLTRAQVAEIVFSVDSFLNPPEPEEPEEPEEPQEP
ncbi:MAG: S-layer homology domain-containing protein [Clostridia bacterium]|nr:S-layer homology domain-containing protein [Clostridia bacterium]